MKSFISSLILTGALLVSIPMSAQRPMNERVHDKVATKEAPRIQFVGKKQGPNLFQSAAASVTADFSCQSAGSAVTVWEEDFDDGTDGWTITNAEDFSWTVKKITSTTDPSRDFSTYDPDDVQSLYIEGPYQSFKRGIAMATSGQIDVPANAMLKGYIGFTQNIDDYCRLQISVSADAFETSEILWNSAVSRIEHPGILVGRCRRRSARERPLPCRRRTRGHIGESNHLARGCLDLFYGRYSGNF